MNELTKKQKRELMREFMSGNDSPHFSKYDIRQNITITMMLYMEDNLAQLTAGMPEFRNAKFDILPSKVVGKIGLDALAKVMPVSLLVEYKQALEAVCVQEAMDLFPKWLEEFQRGYKREAFTRSSQKGIEN